MTNIVLVLFLLVMPATIDVRVTGLAVCEPEMKYQTQTIDFKEYVKGTLPNEWHPTWHEESLKAGALAVKMYAWSMYESQGYVWDCNWNQVYDPAKRTAMTDKAVDDTWDWTLLEYGNPYSNKAEIVRTYYDDYPAACYSRGHECMSQWQTQTDAVIGHKWQNIVMKNYEGELVNAGLVIDRHKPRIN